MDANKRMRPARAAQQQAVSQLQQVFQGQGPSPSTGVVSFAPTVQGTTTATSPIPPTATANTTTSKGKRSASEDVPLTPDERMATMRRHAPLIYDSILHHNLDWGSLSVCWGGEAPSTNRLVVDSANYAEEHNFEQGIYFASRSDGSYNSQGRTWTGSPGELFVGRVAIPRLRTVHRNGVGKFQEMKRSSRVAVAKRIIHPGEVNRIRALPQAPHIIATHTDSPIVYIWNTLNQPHRTENMSMDDAKSSSNGSNAPSTSTTQASSTNNQGKKKTGVWTETCKCSDPDLELIGHEANAEYALDTKGANRVLSGGSDNRVLLWSLEDAMTGKVEISPRMQFEGHQAAVEDCSFRPIDDSTDRCCSVGQDRSLLLWDARQSSPTDRRENSHKDDANCCAWSVNDMILTGGSDHLVNVFDVRKLETPVCTIQHKDSVLNVRWSPDDPNVFLTSDEGANLTIYRLDGANKKCDTVFQHLGHRTPVVDVQFNPLQAWTLASVSDDSADEARGGGGTLQVWRVSEFIYRSLADKEWVAEIEQAYVRSTKSGVGSDEESADD